MSARSAIGSNWLLGCLVAVLLALALSSCSRQTVRVGAKNFAENEILAEMFALLLEDAGLNVERRIPLGDTDVVFEALRNGSIDLYPEYTGTGLLMLGLPGTPDPDRAYSVVSREFAGVGLTVLDRLGFENSYAVIVTAETANQHALETLRDLAGRASDLRIGVTEEFARRPTDGLQPFVDHFALDFATTQIVTSQQGHELYDMLLDGRLDVIVGLQTDPQIADYQLRVLDAERSFFPAYEAVPLVARTALAQSPIIGRTLQRLQGVLNAERVRALNSKVVLSGRGPREVAREALYELGLLKGQPVRPGVKIRLAIDPWEAGSTMASNILRAARQTVPGYELEFLGSAAPVSAIARREARVAVVPSIAQFEIEGRHARLRPALETIAATGSVFVHALALADYQGGLSDARTVAAGPVASPAYKLASALSAWHNLTPQVVLVSDTGAQAAVDALVLGRADVAIVVATLNRADLVAAFRGEIELKLLDANDWWVGAARLALPFLRFARIADGTYEGVGSVQTLSMQATVVGPSPSRSVIGPQGPSSYSDSAYPVTDKLVLNFNEHLGPHPSIGPHLERAAVLRPDFKRAESTLNRTPSHTVLSVGVIAYVAWCAWLLLGTRRGQCSSAQTGQDK